MMDTTWMISFGGLFVTLIGILIAYFQWRRDVQIKLEALHDEVTVELVKQRVEPYANLMKQLEKLSGYHLAKKEEGKGKKGFDILQDAIYGHVGLLASHDTREILVYAREGCVLFSDGKIEKEDFGKRLWAVHLALRSDLGIAQPEWPNEIERLRKKIESDKNLQLPRHRVYDENTE